MVIPLPARVSLTDGIDVHTAFPDLQATAIQRCMYHRLTRHHRPARWTLFSCLVVRPRRMRS